jgi:hypothetical protein
MSSTTNAATASGNVDTLGADFLVLDVYATTSNAATNNMSVLKLAESDDTVVTNFSDISGFVGDTDFTIPTAVTAATSNTLPVAKFNVDLKGVKRYVKISASPVTTQTIHASGNLYRNEESPRTASKANAGVLVEG